MRRGLLFWGLSSIVLASCGEDVDDEAADLERPSGLVAVPRSDTRTDLIIADSEADGLRVLQLDGGDDVSLRSNFVGGPAVFKPVLVPAPGFPTEAAAHAGTVATATSATRRAFALAPGSDTLHVTWIPTQPFAVSSTRLEGHRRIGSLAINSPSVGTSTLASLSLLDLDPGLRDFLPVDLVVTDELGVEDEACGDNTGVLTRALLLLQARSDAAAPGALLALDLLTAEPGELCAFDGSSFPMLVRANSGVVGARLLRVPAPANARELVLVPDGLVVVTVDASEGGAGLAFVPGLNNTLSVLTSSVATGGPASGAFALPAGSSGPAGFAWLRSDEPIMETFLCSEPSTPLCVSSTLAVSGPYDVPEEGLVSGPGRLVLRESAVVAAAFGFSPFRLSDAVGGLADVTATALEEGVNVGVAALVHRDGVVSILSGPPSQLSYVTQRERDFVDEGEVTTRAQRRFAEISPRNELGARTGPPGCANVSTDEDVTRELDADRWFVGQAPFACIDDPDNADEDAADFQSIRSPTDCPDVVIEPRPLDGVFRASFQGALFEGTANDILETALFSFSESEIEVFYESVLPPVDFVEREIRVGDAVHFFATCEAIDGPDIEVAIASPTSVAEGAGVVQLVEPQRLRFDFANFFSLERETSPRQMAFDPSVDGPFAFARLCESVRVDRIEVFPRSAEAVLSRETDGGDIIEVVDRVPVEGNRARFTRGIRFEWEAQDGFACLHQQGTDRRDPETGQIPDAPNQRPLVTCGGQECVPARTEVPCANSIDCGPGRNCVGGSARDCAGVCVRDCTSFGACFVGLIQRSCPEIELQVNGDDPVLVDLNPANATAGGIRFPGAVPEEAVHVPNRDSVFVSFPGSRTLRELRFTEEGISVGLLR
ncbi:MAG: hypothetical protein AAF851_00580 [Myxococcota bacterium]